MDGKKTLQTHKISKINLPIALSQKGTKRGVPPKRAIKPKKKTTWDPENGDQQLYRFRKPSVHIRAEVWRAPGELFPRKKESEADELYYGVTG